MVNELHLQFHIFYSSDFSRNKLTCSIIAGVMPIPIVLPVVTTTLVLVTSHNVFRKRVPEF